MCEYLIFHSLLLVLHLAVTPVRDEFSETKYNNSKNSYYSKKKSHIARHVLLIVSIFISFVFKSILYQLGVIQISVTDYEVSTSSSNNIVL